MRKIVCSTTSEICTSYKEYLRSQHWRNVRDAFRESPRHKDECYICKATASYTTTMNIHHRSYENLGKEKDQDLVELCQPCHKKVHEVVNSKVAKMTDICFAVEYVKHQWKLANSRKFRKQKAVKLLRVV